MNLAKVSPPKYKVMRSPHFLGLLEATSTQPDCIQHPSPALGASLTRGQGSGWQKAQLSPGTDGQDQAWAAGSQVHPVLFLPSS
jgi:hypothetical protein